MDADSTVPSRILRGLLRASVSSAIDLLHRLVGGDLTGPQLGVDAGDLALQLLQAGVVVELTSHVLEPQVEQLLLRFRQPLDELIIGEVANFCGFLIRHQSASSRVTKRALIASFWMARSSASRATTLSGYDSSNRMRPGRTTATQRSGLPLPEPMRVSAGFSVTGLSGKMLIQTLPPRLMWRVIAIRAASIWRAVTHPGSRAWMPYSPNTTSVPPFDGPLVRPRCVLRCLTLRGINMASPNLRCGTWALRGADAYGARCLLPPPAGARARGRPL